MVSFVNKTPTDSANVIFSGCLECFVFFDDNFVFYNYYLPKTLFSFFDGLIPEGWLLDVITRNWKMDRKDRFGLLLVSCRDAIGNVSIRGEKT